MQIFIREHFNATVYPSTWFQNGYEWIILATPFTGVNEYAGGCTVESTVSGLGSHRHNSSHFYKSWFYKPVFFNLSDTCIFSGFLTISDSLIWSHETFLQPISDQNCIQTAKSESVTIRSKKCWNKKECSSLKETFLSLI